MKICSANLYYNVASANESPSAFLERMPLLRELPASLVSAGHEVDVVQLYATEASFSEAGVNYHFVRPTTLEKSWARVASWVERRIWTRHVPALSAVRKVLGLQPDVVHFHRLTLSTSLYLLQLLRGKDGPAIVGQYHGGRLTEGRLLHSFQAKGLSQMQRGLFGRREMAEPFLKAGLLDEGQVVELADRSTTLRMNSRPAAREKSGMQGSPVFLWYADLEPERDPMTAVLGFEQLAESWPKAQLYVYYEGDALLTQLRAYVIAHPTLAGRVHFRSGKATAMKEPVFNSADYLLQTDLQANNGHAVLEAMACGVIPVVSDIPFFRGLIDNGRCGFLFPKGDAEALARQLLKISPGKIAGRAAVVHDWFEAAYSYDAMAGVLLDIYGEVIGERRTEMEMVSQALTVESSQ